MSLNQLSGVEAVPCVYAWGQPTQKEEAQQEHSGLKEIRPKMLIKYMQAGVTELSAGDFSVVISLSLKDCYTSPRQSISLHTLIVSALAHHMLQLLFFWCCLGNGYSFVGWHPTLLISGVLGILASRTVTRYPAQHPMQGFCPEGPPEGQLTLAGFPGYVRSLRLS